MHIETININLHSDSGQPNMARAFIEAMLRAPELSEPPETDGSQANTAPSTPKIGEYWIDQGGIYAGIARGRDGEPDYHLILANYAPDTEFTWQAALDHAKTICLDGHDDFSVPTRWESALLYANVQDKLDTSHWHWTSTQFSEDRAWDQHFHYGSQSSTRKSFEARCRFVRRLVL